MPSNDALDERMRSVELSSTKAATAPASPAPSFEAHRSAEATMEMMKEKYDNAGAQIHALSATVRANETVFRSEVTMNPAAAEALFGKPSKPQHLRERAEAYRAWYIGRSFRAHLND